MSCDFQRNGNPGIVNPGIEKAPNLHKNCTAGFFQYFDFSRNCWKVHWLPWPQQTQTSTSSEHSKSLAFGRICSACCLFLRGVCDKSIPHPIWWHSVALCQCSLACWEAAVGDQGCTLARIWEFAGERAGSFTGMWAGTCTRRGWKLHRSCWHMQHSFWNLQRSFSNLERSFCKTAAQLKKVQRSFWTIAAQFLQIPAQLL